MSEITLPKEYYYYKYNDEKKYLEDREAEKGKKTNICLRRGLLNQLFYVTYFQCFCAGFDITTVDFNEQVAYSREIFDRVEVEFDKLYPKVDDSGGWVNPSMAFASRVLCLEMFTDGFGLSTKKLNAEISNKEEIKDLLENAFEDAIMHMVGISEYHLGYEVTKE